MWLGGLSGGTIRNWLALANRAVPPCHSRPPPLRMARVCEDERDGLIAILRDFANNGTSYIVPWKSLPLMVAMTELDVALHDAVAETKASTPAAVRAAVSRLALSGALGPEAKARETQHTQTEKRARRRYRGHPDPASAEFRRIEPTRMVADPDRRQAAETRAAIAAAAKQIGVRRDEIYLRISEFASCCCRSECTPGGTSAPAGCACCTTRSRDLRSRSRPRPKPRPKTSRRSWRQWPTQPTALRRFPAPCSA